MSVRPPIDGGTVLITGASSGIGLELARSFAARAGHLVLVARREALLNQLADELRLAHPQLRVTVARCDLGSVADIDALLTRLAADVGDIDVLVNNAGLGDLGAFHLADGDKLQQLLAVNVLGLTHLTHRLIGGMYQRRRGGVLNVSSGFGLEILPGVAVYAGSKHYVTAFTEVLRLEARSFGVVVSQLCPGPVATEFDQRASHPGAREIPAFLHQDATACARIGFQGFRRGRAIIVTTPWLRPLLWLGAVSPRWLKRLVYAPAARHIVG